MKIEHNTVALIAYKIHIDSPSGEMIEFADERNPRSMIFGINQIMPGFEENLMGTGENTEFDFHLTPDEAFGEYKDDLIVDVTKSAFMVEGKIREDLLYINNEINMMDNQGNPVKGKVLEVGNEKVKMDFNHPLAGKPLFISGKIMNVRPVTQEDLQPKNSGCCGGGCDVAVMMKILIQVITIMTMKKTVRFAATRLNCRDRALASASADKNTIQ